MAVLAVKGSGYPYTKLAQLGFNYATNILESHTFSNTLFPTLHNKMIPDKKDM